MTKAKSVMTDSDLTMEALTDEQFGDLVQRVVGECHRRGDAATAALRSALTAALAASGLDADERARVAAESARREAERLREDEARRVATEAAERVRRQQEVEKARRKEDEARKEAERLRALAQRARDLMGHDVANFIVQVWSRDGERRVYIGHGYNANWVEYYHTGSARILPGTIKFSVAVDRSLAAHLGCTRDEAQERIKSYCAELCREWRTLRLEVTEDNAPCDPACQVQRWVLRSEKSGNYIERLRPAKAANLTSSAQEALKYRSREEAEAALDAARAEGAPYLDGYIAVERQVWLVFPPKEAE